MELRCAIIFTVVGLVTATPHGYGVKGGSSAKAASGAAAGALSGTGELLPVAVPHGAGFSGSFSKSSSASYSSASSSSSSSSFSFSGSGAGGYASHGSNGASGCNTGNCHNTGSIGLPSAIDGSGAGTHVNGYNTFDAATAAGAAAGTQGIECHGSSCSGDSSKCTSGLCPSKKESDVDSINSSPKCTSGQCGAVVENGESLADHGPNDIQVVYDSSKLVDNTKKQTSDYDKASYDSTGSGCSSGSCGPTGQANTKPSSSSYDSPSGPDSLHATGYGKNTGYQVPTSQHDTGSGCTGGSIGGCGPSAPSNTKPGYIQGVLSSYDSASASDTTHATGFGKNADYQAQGAQYNTKDLSSNHDKPSYGTTGSGCSSGNSGGCGPSAPSNIKPGFVHGASSLYDSASASDTTHAAGFGKNADYNANYFSPNHDKPSYSDTGSGCSGGNSKGCGPTAPANTGYQEPSAQHDTKGHKSNQDTPSYVDSGPDCSSGSCRPPVPANTKLGYVHGVSSSYSGASGSGTQPQQATGLGINTSYQTPASHLETPKLDSNCNTQNCNPSYNPSLPSSYNVPIHGSFDYNSNPDKPCDGSKCATQPKWSYTSGGTVSSNYLSPQHLPSLEKKEPTYSSLENCQGSNCGLRPSSPSVNPSSYQPSNSNKKEPLYTGGFGGPSGMLKPNDDYHAPATNFQSHTSSSAQTPVGKPTGCKSPDCKDYPIADTVSAPGYSHTNKPVIGVTPSKETTPFNTGSLGGPVGSHKPDELGGHTSSTNYGHASSGTIQEVSSFGTYPTGCATSNCIQPAGTQPSGTHTSSGSIPNSSVSHPGHTIGISSTSVTSPSSIIPQSPVGTGTYSTGCNTAGCQISSTNNVQSESFGTSNVNAANHYKPEGSYGAHTHPSICKNANCGNLPTGTPGVLPGIGAYPGSLAHPKPSNDASKENLPPYTGGFGGPSGVLAPNKDSIPASNGYITPPATGIAQPVVCSSGKCDSKPSHVVTPSSISSSSGALAVATADANAVAYTGGFGGPPGLLKPYDDYKLDSISLGGSTYNPSGNIHSHHSAHVGTNAAQKVGTSSHEGSTASAGLQTGGLAGSASFSGAASNSGSLGWSGSGGYNKGISPCGDGCGVSGNGSDGSSSHGYGTKTGAAATAKSLSGASAYGVSGGFASSSASAHASSGAYTKGGYGRR